MPSLQPHILAALLLAACGDKEAGTVESAPPDTGEGSGEGSEVEDTATVIVDEDGDGYGPDEDCDDEDPSINPDANEWCDGLDNNCDGEIDEGLMRTAYVDEDGDGYGDPDTPVECCKCTPEFTSDSSDCLDSDPEVHPYVDELCDGIDNNCDGDVDERCPTGTVLGPSDAMARLHGEASGDHAASLSSVGDINGDGRSDLWLGAPGCGTSEGAAYLFYGPVSGEHSLAEADARIDGDVDHTYLGETVAGAGDQDGDGVPDLLLGGAPASGDLPCAYLIHGPLTGPVGFEAVDATLIDDHDDSTLWHWVKPAGDLNGDSIPDLLVGEGSAYLGGGWMTEGRVYVVQGPMSGALHSNSAQARITSRELLDLASIGDTNGDGLDDFGLVQESGYSYSTNGKGAWFFYGPVEGDLSFEDANGWWDLDSSGEYIESLAPLGDSNGDGYDDFVLGAPYSDKEETNSGKAYVVRGAVRGGGGAEDTMAQLLGAESGGYAGSEVAAAGEADGDGVADLLIGAPDESFGGDHAGVAYLALGPVSGTLNLRDSAAMLVGEEPGGGFGRVSFVGDTNGDGRDELLVSAPYESVGGAVYIFEWGG